MHAAQLQQHVRATYRAVRWAIAALGLALPWVLWLGGKLREGLPLQGSVSAYYYTMMRDELVAMLVAASALLVVYQGYTRLEDWALNLAGVFLGGVALFPMRAGCAGACRGFAAHGTFAVLFFASIAYVCVFRASDTLTLLHDPALARRYARIYRLLGAGMIASPLLALILAFALDPVSPRRSLIFFVEVAGVYVFAAYWIVKGRELARTDAEVLAMQGELATPPHGARQVFSPIPVRRKGSEQASPRVPAA